MTSTPPRGQGWAAIRSRIASAPAIVTTSARQGLVSRTNHPGGGLCHADERARGAGRVDAALCVRLHPRSLAPRSGSGGGCPSFPGSAQRHSGAARHGPRPGPGGVGALGLDNGAGFAVYHRVLSLGRWSSRAVAHRLLLLLVAALVPTGPVVIGLDDTIERRWGAKIKARGIYRDPVRSSHGHFVKASGLRWLCVMLLAPIPWAGCVGALPFLTMLAPSERYATERGHRHKKLTDWARQGLLQTVRWLPGRRVIAVGDSSFSAIELLRDVGRHLGMISRLRPAAGL